MQYFSYGSNCCKQSMKERCPSAKAIGKTTLNGWRLTTGMHCNVVEDADSSVIGVLWEISNEDELALDTYEGFPSYYIKKTVDTEHGSALIYVMRPQYEHDSHSPSAYYSRIVTEAYAQWGIPLMQYVNSISDVNVFKSNRNN